MLRLITLPPSCADCLKIPGPSTSCNPLGLSKPVNGWNIGEVRMKGSLYLWIHFSQQHSKIQKEMCQKQQILYIADRGTLMYSETELSQYRFVHHKSLVDCRGSVNKVEQGQVCPWVARSPFLNQIRRIYCQFTLDSDSLRAGRSGYRIPAGGRFSAPVQTGPGAHPPSYTMGTRYLRGVKGPGRGADHPPPI